MSRVRSVAALIATLIPASLQVRPSVQPQAVMDEGKIFIANLSKGRLGETTSQLLGALLVASFDLAARRRADMPEAERRDFALYADEFQNFASAGDDVPKGEPRYRTPKEFQKHQVLYNLHRVRGAKHVYVVEGCFDTIALHAFGFPAVALMGNSISPEQVELLWRAGVRFATVLLDGNPEGRAAAPAVHQALGERGLFSRIGMLPEGTDPATVGRDTFLALHKTER